MVTKKLKNHESTAHSDEKIEQIKKIKPGEGQKDHSKSYGSAYRRLVYDEPCPTITKSCHRDFLHPTKHRTLTVREVACIQTFPLEWEFVGIRNDTHDPKRKKNLTQFAQVGNAVPPLLSKVIGEELKKHLFNEGDK